MSAQQPNLRDGMNNANGNRLNAVFQALGLGDLMALIIRGLTPTETGVSPSSNVATLANVPSVMLQVNATSGTSTGIKDLLIGPISGAGAVVPAAGQAVWAPGTKKVLFAAADGVTAASFTYAQGTEKASILTRYLGESDSGF